MIPCSKLIRTIGQMTVLVFWIATVSGPAYSATAPLVSSLSPITTGISTPVRLAGDLSGNFYVTDPRGGGILKFSGTGALQQTITTVKQPVGIAVAQNGDLLVSQGTSVAVLNKTSGALTTQFGTFVNANGIAVDSAGTIYVTDSANNCVQVFSAAYAPLTTGVAAVGKPLNSFGSDGTLTGQFLQPTGISFEKLSNQLAVVDTLNGRVQFFSTAGVYQKSIGSFGSGPLKFTFPQAIAFEYSQVNNVLTLSRLYVVDAQQSTIQVIDAATGSFLNFVGSYGFVSGEMATPGDTFFDSFDSLNKRLVISSGNGSLALFSIDTITGRCGSANSGSFSAAPTANLCSYGTAANFTGTGPWSWNCAGSNGGTSQACSATLSAHLVNITITNNNGGSGSVTSNPAAIDCPNRICSSSFIAGSSVVLTAFANSDSIFTGWSGDCNGSGQGNCTLNMTIDHSATATFDVNPIAMVNGTFFGSLTKAYTSISVSGSGIIQAQAQTFIENLLLSRGSTVTLTGGYDSAYSAVRSGYTVLNGTLTIGTGSLIVDRLVVK